LVCIEEGGNEMSDAKFTPGPWRIERDACKFVKTIGPISAEKDSAGSWLCIIDEDAHLISAAPEMYELLYKISKGEVSFSLDLLNEIDKVLAKARGEVK
jgi:hypothetical protein